jgi:hypothetical protein
MQVSQKKPKSLTNKFIYAILVNRLTTILFQHLFSINKNSDLKDNRVGLFIFYILTNGNKDI